MSSTQERPAVASVTDVTESLLGRVAARLLSLSERYLPDAFVFALLGTALVVAAALPGHGPGAVVDAWGKGFWSLLPFTLQMSLVIITGHMCATSPAAARLIARAAASARTGRGAVALLALVAMLSSWVNWGLSLILSAMLARALSRELHRRGVRVDYRALGAASFLGLGSIWAQGLSGSAAIQMATRGALPEALVRVVDHGGLVPGGVIPLSRTIFLWQSLLSVAIEVVLVTLVMWRAAPVGARAVTAAELGVDLEDAKAAAGPASAGPPRTAGERLEQSPILSALVVLLGVAYLYRYFAAAGHVLDAINLNTVNLGLLLLGVALHRTPAGLMAAFQRATPAVWGVLLQFPFYGGIAGILTATRLSQQVAGFFVSLSTPHSYPPLIALYSAVLGVFVPSGGAKWVIEAPYVMGAAHELKVHLGWMVACYDLGEALANLVQPFWMVPVLSLLGLRARDVMGYTILVFLTLLPLVLLLTYALGRTLSYPF